ALPIFLAEMMAETALIRAAVRSVLWETGRVCASKHDKLAEGQGQDYKDYFTFSESARQIPPHRILALNRGEKEHAIKVRLDWNADDIKDTALKSLSEQLLHVAGRMPPLPPAAPATPSGMSEPVLSPSTAQVSDLAPGGTVSDPTAAVPPADTRSLPESAPPFT